MMKTLRAIEDLPKQTPLYLFGAGEGGQTLMRLLEGRAGGCSVAGFMDNQKTGTVAGKPVVSVAQVKASPRGSYAVVIASMHVYEISAQLRHNGILDIWNGHPFVMNVIERRRRRRAMLQLGGFVVGVVVSAFGLFRLF